MELPPFFKKELWCCLWLDLKIIVDIILQGRSLLCFPMLNELCILIMNLIEIMKRLWFSLKGKSTFH